MQVLIITGGILPDDAVLLGAAQAADAVLCADMGAQTALRLGVPVHRYVGDMDSLPAELLAKIRRQDTSVEQHPREKDETDTQLAVDMAIAMGATQVTIAGGLTGRGGGRFDHGLGNLLLLIRLHQAHIPAVFWDACNRIQVIMNQIVSLPGRPGALISLFPFGEGVVITEFSGVRYPLHHYTLPIDRPLGISNEFIDTQATLEVRGGYCFVIQSRDA